MTRLDNPENWFLYENYVHLVVSEEMDDLYKLEQILDATPYTEPYSEIFCIKLPEPAKFFQSLLGWISVFEINLKTIELV